MEKPRQPQNPNPDQKPLDNPDIPREKERPGNPIESPRDFPDPTVQPDVIRF